jgi:hypothetical protein
MDYGHHYNFHSEAVGESITALVAAVKDYDPSQVWDRPRYAHCKALEQLAKSIDLQGKRLLTEVSNYREQCAREWYRERQYPGLIDAKYRIAVSTVARDLRRIATEIRKQQNWDQSEMGFDSLVEILDNIAVLKSEYAREEAEIQSLSDDEDLETILVSVS